MLYCDTGTILRKESKVLYLTNGSDIAVIKARSDGAWLDSYEVWVQLPYTYTGTTTRIWMCSDTHVLSTTRRDAFITQIADIDNIGVGYVFVNGDLVTGGTVTNFDWFVEARATSSVSSARWHEIAGNHDDDPTSDFSDFESYFGADRDFIVNIGNVAFVCWGGLDEDPTGHHSSESISFLQTSLENNQDKNIILLAHQPRVGLTPKADIDTIITNNRVDIWFNGHSHMDIANDAASIFDPLALYENVEIGEGIEFFHCPSAGTSAFGTFKFSARPFGKNVIGYDCIGISESIEIKFNEGIVFGRADSIEFSESLARTVEYKLELSDNLSIAEDLSKKPTRHLSDELSVISDLVANQSNLNISDLVSITEETEIEYVDGREAKSEWRFFVKDSSGNTIASLVNARKRWLTQKLNKESEAGFILDADDDNCNTTILAIGVNELHIEYNGTLIWAGQIISTKKIASGNDTYWEVLAKDWVALLGKRFCGVEELREFTTTDAGTIAWTLVDETQNLTNGDFGITEGTVEASINRTTTYDKKNILGAITELSNMGKDGEANYGFDFEITPLKVFNVYYPYKGTIRNDVVFRYPNNCEDFEAFVDSWDIVNQEWGLGTHWTGTNSIVSRADATSQTTYKRREAIKTYGDMSVLAFLQDMVYQDVQWNKDPSTVIRFTSRVDAKTGILDYEIGDGVVVICDKFDIDEWLWVYERKIDIGDNDEAKVNLLVGN